MLGGRKLVGVGGVSVWPVSCLLGAKLPARIREGGCLERAAQLDPRSWPTSSLPGCSSSLLGPPLGSTQYPGLTQTGLGLVEVCGEAVRPGVGSASVWFGAWLGRGPGGDTSPPDPGRSNGAPGTCPWTGSSSCLPSPGGRAAPRPGSWVSGHTLADRAQELG